MIRALFLVLAATLLPQQAPGRDAATQTQTGSASISGVVIAAADKQPIGFARVALNSNDRITYANAKGEFHFPKLPAGRYVISVQATGFLGMSLGQTRTGRPGIAQVVADGEERKGVTLAMHQGGVVSGHIVGPDNRPLAGVVVRNLRKSWRQDGGILFDMLGQTRTDDRGDYRMSGMTPGAYLVEAFPPSITGQESYNAATFDIPQRLAVEGMIPTFYPNTTDPSLAMPISVDVDSERAGVDFNIQRTMLWTVTGRVDGVVTGAVPTSRPGAGGSEVNAGGVQLRPVDKAAGGIFVSNEGREPFVRVGPDGRFRLEAVPSGEYELFYRRRSDPSTDGAFGTSTITVSDRDISDVVIPASPAPRISGEIVAAPAATRFPELARIGLVPVSGTGATLGTYISAAVAGSEFLIPDLSPGGYALRVSSASTASYISRIDIDGVANAGTRIQVGPAESKKVRVTYRTDVAEVSGNVRHEDGSPVTEYALVIFPADKREWPIWMTGAGVSRADSSGRYTYSTRPGSYLIAAVDDVEQNQWLDPAFLETLIPTATKITLGPGQKLAQDFVVK